MSFNNFWSRLAPGCAIVAVIKNATFNRQR